MKEKTRLSMNVVETDSGHADPDEIEKIHKKFQKKGMKLGDYATEVRSLGGDVLFGNVDIKTNEEYRETIESLMKAYKSGKISLHEMRAKIEEVGGEATFWDWEIDKNPNFESHESKLGFTWNPYFNKKGRFMQHITKRVLIKMCDFVYKSILKYDEAAFTFSDPRLVYLRNSIEKFITNNLTAEYKKDLVRKLTDCALFMLKEDVYYRALALKMINETPREFEITKDEMYFFNRGVPKE